MSFDPFQQAGGGTPNPNPYHSPMAAPSPVQVGGTHSFEDLKQIAQYQRWMVGMVGAQLLFWCGGNIAFSALQAAVVQPGQPPPLWLSFLALAFLAVLFAVLVGTVAALALVGNKLWGVGAAVLCGILGFLPCIGLITLVVVNGSATSILQRHGYTVGFLGCNDPRLK
jgi:hypothetical protein